MYPGKEEWESAMSQQGHRTAFDIYTKWGEHFLRNQLGNSWSSLVYVNIVYLAKPASIPNIAPKSE